MNNSGDAAEQVVRDSALRDRSCLKAHRFRRQKHCRRHLCRSENRDKNKIRGKQRLTAMLKRAKEPKVFTISEEHLKQFATEIGKAVRRGLLCFAEGKEPSADGMVDVMVRAEDASKINRIVERFAGHGGRRLHQE